MKLFRSLKGHFSIVAVTSLIVVFAMLNGYGSNSGQTGQTAPIPETFRFVFLADSRGGGATGLGHPIDTEVLDPIIQTIKNLNPPPKFVIFGGDMAYRGYIYTHDYPTGYTFQMWKDLFSDLENAGIPVYTAIGNHELYRHDDIHPDNGFALENQQKFQNVFSENPTNGPPGYEHLAYSFTSPGGDSFFAVLDPYYLTSDVIPDGLGGNIDPIELSWLTNQVAQSKAMHKFLFIHTPYYYVSNDPEESSAANQSFTELWSFLDTNNFDFYACGHQHLFSVKTIDSNVPPDPQTTPPTTLWKNSVVQLLNGTCGAPISTGPIDPGIKTLWDVHNDAQTYYFSVVDISGRVVTVNSYSGNTGTYSIFDTFSIDKSRRSIPTATGTGTATFTTSSGCISNLTALATTPCGTTPAASLNFPQGFFSFNITPIAPGSTVTITATLPSNMPANTQYWKCVNWQWVQIPVVSVVGNVMTIQLTDGGPGDADGVANGTIVDPGGPAIPVVNPNPTPHGASMPAQPESPVLLASISVKSATLSATNVAPGMPVTVRASVANSGNANGSSVIKLYVNGEEETSQSVKIESGKSVQVTFTVSRNEPGTYTVSVGGAQAGSFVVDQFADPNIILYISGALLLFAFVFGVILIIRRRQR